MNVTVRPDSRMSGDNIEYFLHDVNGNELRRLLFEAKDSAELVRVYMDVLRQRAVTHKTLPR